MDAIASLRLKDPEARSALAHPGTYDGRAGALNGVAALASTLLRPDEPADADADGSVVADGAPGPDPCAFGPLRDALKDRTMDGLGSAPEDVVLDRTAAVAAEASGVRGSVGVVMARRAAVRREAARHPRVSAARHRSAGSAPGRAPARSR